MCRDNFSGCNHMQRICEETTFQVVIIDNMCRDDFSGSNHREYVKRQLYRLQSQTICVKTISQVVIIENMCRDNFTTQRLGEIGFKDYICLVLLCDMILVQTKRIKILKGTCNLKLQPSNDIVLHTILAIVLIARNSPGNTTKGNERLLNRNYECNKNNTFMVTIQFLFHGFLCMLLKDLTVSIFEF